MFSPAYLTPFDPPLPTTGPVARPVVFLLPPALVADLDALAGPGGNRADALALALDFALELVWPPAPEDDPRFRAAVDEARAAVPGDVPVTVLLEAGQAALLLRIGGKLRVPGSVALTALVAGMAHRIRRHYDQGPARRRAR